MTGPIDPLSGPPAAAAAHAHLEALARCLLRETDAGLRAGRIDADLGGTRLRAGVRYWSETGQHAFGPFSLCAADGTPITEAPDPALVAGLIATAHRAPPGEVTELVARVADSTRNTARFLRERRSVPAAPEADGFLAAERSLVLGHLHHPTPKSREGLSPGELAAYSPELGGRFRPHWFAVDPSVVHQHWDTPGVTAAEVVAKACGVDPGDRVLVPAHPWQAREVVHRPGVRALIDAGLVAPLGPLGEHWWATSSLRTVYRPGAPVMMKFSLGLRLTNSRRELLPEYLRRGPEVNRLLNGGLADEVFAAHPGFTILRDPGWLAVTDDPDRLTGLEVALREAPGDLGELRCLAGLLAPGPGPSALAGLCASSGLGARRWVADYAALVLVPMLHLYAATGIGLEAHQQNTLVRLRGGRIAGAAFRDNEGYYLAASRLPPVLATTGRDRTDLAVTADAVVEDRLGYYLLRNQAFGVIAGLASREDDEWALLGVLADSLRAALPTLDAAGPDGGRLARRWLTASTLPGKANLLTRLRGIDEMRAPLDAQSVYLDLPNPLESR